MFNSLIKALLCRNTQMSFLKINTSSRSRIESIPFATLTLSVFSCLGSSRSLKLGDSAVPRILSRLLNCLIDHRGAVQLHFKRLNHTPSTFYSIAITCLYTEHSSSITYDLFLIISYLVNRHLAQDEPSALRRCKSDRHIPNNTSNISPGQSTRWRQ